MAAKRRSTDCSCPNTTINSTPSSRTRSTLGLLVESAAPHESVVSTLVTLSAATGYSFAMCVPALKCSCLPSFGYSTPVRSCKESRVHRRRPCVGASDVHGKRSGQAGAGADVQLCSLRISPPLTREHWQWYLCRTAGGRGARRPDGEFAKVVQASSKNREANPWNDSKARLL